MLGLFAAGALLSTEDRDFHIATFSWLLRNFGADECYRSIELILPTREYFPDTVSDAEQAALATFQRVKQYAGMANWECKLTRQEQEFDSRIHPTVALENAPVGPLGTFRATSDNEVEITYSPAILNKPVQMVSTFAHELSHYLTATAEDPPPGGWENWEFATDITATFLGFGIFMANSAKNFEQYTAVDSQGWSLRNSGYLTEAEHIYALALFLRLHHHSPVLATKHLKPVLKKALKSALKEIDASDVIAQLRATQCIERGAGKDQERESEDKK